MALFDVHRVTGGVLVLDCQSDLLADFPTRFVVPLRVMYTSQRSALTRLCPVFEVEGQKLAMVTPLARGIDRRDIEETVGNLARHEAAIRAALTMLTSGL